MKRAFAVLVALAALIGPAGVHASSEEKPVIRNYASVFAPPAPRNQTWEQADAKSASCRSCHTASDAKTMHKSDAVVLGCTDCHGGNAKLAIPAGLAKTDHRYAELRDQAHVLPRFPEAWGYEGHGDGPYEKVSSANPKRGYTILNREAPEFIKFVNPSDYRVVREACGACHQNTIDAAERSIMASGAMLWNGAGYNNGIIPFKRGALGEAYTREGEPACLLTADINPAPPGKGSVPGVPLCAQPIGAELNLLTPDAIKRGAIERLLPMPMWTVYPPADLFRVFERGGRNVNTQFAEVGLPNSTGLTQKLEEPGRPDIRQSNRGPATGLRISVPLINIHKTRLNDPLMWFMGTNDQPGDYRTSGCGACHVVYANDREPRHSMTFSKFGRDGTTATVDPTIPRNEGGHPVEHAFTRSIPTSQCMPCHMHQPNMFLNTYLGYTMWDYESDAPRMWPEKQQYPSSARQREVLDRNPEATAPYGKWADLDFVRNVYDVNAGNKDTQFADYHGHGWNFRGIFKRDRLGNLLDKDGDQSTWGTDTKHIVANDDPEKWRWATAPKFVEPGTKPGPGQPGKSVHMFDIHTEVGMQCADCHFAQDGHGNGYIHTEVANAVQIGCKDCHGTADSFPTLITSNLAAGPKGQDLSLIRNPDGKRRFEWAERDGRRVLIQRSIMDSREWIVSLVKDTVTPGNPRYNEKAARAKLMGYVTADGRQPWGLGVPANARAHQDSNMACFSCHMSWTTSCGGCHLPIEANWKTELHHYEGGETRNWASYNPQVARDEIFQLGRHMTTKDHIIAPVRSSSALILSSTNVNRERIYVQQQPVSSAGYSAQALAPHFPHTVRTTETKTCSDCHVSQANDNNSVLAQTFILGGNYINFVGLHAFVGEAGAVSAIRVTEWREPQAVLGSYLHRYAFPDWYKQFVDRGRELREWRRGPVLGKDGNGETGSAEEIANSHRGAAGWVNCLQAQGEYLYAATGKGGFEVFDVANVGNKGVSERIVRRPFSPLGHNTHVATRNATCVALPTYAQSISPARNTQAIRDMNDEQPMAKSFSYAFVTDSEEGLIAVNVDTMRDREPRNNFLKRASTFNPDGVLTGARHITLGGDFAYITTKQGLAVVNIKDPLKPVYLKTVPLEDARASALQFRYLFVTTAKGLQVMDVTVQGDPQLQPTVVPLTDARKIYLARTYAYVAAKAQGLAIVDIRTADRPKLHGFFTADGKLNDAEDVILGTTNASLFAYVADGRNGLKVLQMTSPESQPNFYGFSPEPKPQLIAWAKTPAPALALSKGLDRDRAVDESGNQISIFGRTGSRPFHRDEMEAFFRAKANGRLYSVTNNPVEARADFTPNPPSLLARR
jgi:hypothetical protein